MPLTYNSTIEQERMLPMGQVCKRYGVTDRTVDRWLERGIIPRPFRINRYRYWRESDLVQFEQTLALERDPHSRPSRPLETVRGPGFLRTGSKA